MRAVDLGRFVAMSLVVLAGCRKPTPVPPQTGPLVFDGEQPPAPEAPATDARPSTPPQDAPAGCAAQGTPWSGRHEGCLYEVKGCCYPDAEAACAAAACESGGCQILESAPAQIVCRAP